MTAEYEPGNPENKGAGMIINKVSNFRIEAGDCQAKCFFDKLEGADGYVIRFYNDNEPDRCIKKRYAERSGKILLGFRNNNGYFATICAFELTEDGEEKYGPVSDRVYFTPFTDRLKAQEKICLRVGESARIEYDYMNSRPKVVFMSTDPGVATVDDNGNVSALSRGEAIVITAMDEEHYAVTGISVDRGRYEHAVCSGSIVFTGDLMCAVRHQTMAAKKSYDFANEMRQIKEKLAFADARVGILETVICDGRPYESEMRRLENGAPNCNSPASFLKALESAGFDVLVSANNHNCDADAEGLESTVALIRQNGMTNAGTYDDNPVYIDAGGIRVALISLCAINNGNESAVDNTPLQKDIGRYSHEYLNELISTAKSENSDYIVVCMHWGDMNSHVISKSQIREAQFIAEAGADIIIGSHPHLIQKVQTVVTSSGKEVICAYSLGNFMTTMNEIEGNRDGAALVLDLKKKGTDVKAAVSFIPFYSTYDNSSMHISPVDLPVTQGAVKALERISHTLGDEIGLYRPKITCIGSGILSRILEGSDEYSSDFSYIGCSMTEYMNKAGDGTELPGAYCFIDMYENAVRNDADLPKVFPEFVRFLRDRYADSHIILLRLGFYNRCVNHDQLRNGSNSSELNERIAFLEEAFIELAHPAVIDIAGYYFRDLTDSKEITSFEPYFYIDANNRLKKITGGDAVLYHYEQDNEIWFKRILRYYDNMLARNYFFWLVENDAAGSLITNTSHRFLAEYSSDIIRIKNTGVQCLHELGACCPGLSEEVLRAAGIILAIEKGQVITDRKDEDLLIKYDFNIIKKYTGVLESRLDHPVSKAEIRDAAAHIDDRETYVSWFARKKVYIDIWGSCISRTAVSRNEDIIVKNYIFKQPAILAFRPPMELTLPNDTSYYGNNGWRMGTIRGSVTHDGTGRLNFDGAGWLIVDFYDLITEVMKFDDDYLELDDFIKRTEFYSFNKKGRKKTYLFEDVPEDEALRAFDEFVDFVKEHFGKNIILVKIDCKNEYLDLEGKIKPLKEDPAFEAKKAYASKFEEIFISKTGCHVIDIAKNYHASDAFPLGGAHIVHYEDEFYTECCSQISKILGLG